MPASILVLKVEVARSKYGDDTYKILYDKTSLFLLKDSNRFTIIRYILL